MPRTDILDQIVDQRREDLRRLGPSFGIALPRKRERPLIPFLKEKGAVLELKRASPSKGDIAPQLDPAAMAHAYAAAGAQNISVLTEGNYFKGSLRDLLEASVAEPNLAYLRKDFLLTEEEVELSYIAGADAVLLIARILKEAQLLRMAQTAHGFGMTAFIEVRDYEDLVKLQTVAAEVPVLSGINARDLSDFSVDPLVPAGLIGSLPGKGVYESGITTLEGAAFAGSLGFHGILVGEGAARNPHRAADLLTAFKAAKPDGAGRFWRTIAEKRLQYSDNPASVIRPLVKICGLTKPEDALLSHSLGADLLGFVFARSKRTASIEVVLETRKLLKSSVSMENWPLFIGVITELESEMAQNAIALLKEGSLDALQWHGAIDIPSLSSLRAVLSSGTDGARGAFFIALGIGDQEELSVYKRLRDEGAPRILVDAKVDGKSGGTGRMLPVELATSLAEQGRLWLAGGLGPDKINSILEHYKPELVDASSALEAAPGRKDPELLKKYFKEIDAYVQR